MKKNFFFSEIVVFAVISPFCEENTCHRQSMCEQAVLRFHIKLVFFSYSISPRVTKK